MGEWAIVVHGTGAHHNKDLPIDADRMAQAFVDSLIGAGHQVQLATFTAGGRTVLDTTENLAVKHSEYAFDENTQNRIDEGLASRVKALQTIGLGQSPRKDPVTRPEGRIATPNPIT